MLGSQKLFAGLLTVTFLAIAIPTNACPFSSSSPTSAVKVPDPVSSNASQAVKPATRTTQTDIGGVNEYGLGAIALVISLASGYAALIRRPMKLRPLTHSDPKLEHPELLLASLPSEAYALSAAVSE
ncbi:MAG TPA: hypothetical protein IGS53_07180 [Leptolyngbyaceae cyanobacterium M33_DOE_097]|uniref:Uncharacterized protein n=1 Tax=Oscillatoriales cyanobacterium SpSt-418 TaxID=2282169 RepID=A0A7C3KAR2_9CYAN|nr:hypothetical protein [Leptolyngbyaceae cyanobacterium M33_DOE_097]